MEKKIKTQDQAIGEIYEILEALPKNSPHRMKLLQTLDLINKSKTKEKLPRAIF